jgi:GNAT superfamily N-acetyltransferase
MGGALVRPAEAGDRGVLEEISRMTWDGGDYLASVLDAWLADGGFMVGELDGEVFGCFKITVQHGGIAWLEGLRVHPGFRGRGLGRILSDHCFDTASRMRGQGLVAAVEFMTYYRNVESISMAHTRGFAVAERFHLLTLGLEGREVRPLEIRGAALEDVDLACYPWHVPVGWAARTVSPGLAESLAGAAEAFTAGGVLMLRKPGDDIFTLLGGALERPEPLPSVCERAAGALGLEYANVMIPDARGSVLQVFRDAGWGYWEEPPEANALVFRLA